jgi:hypothetical protein
MIARTEIVAGRKAIVAERIEVLVVERIEVLVVVIVKVKLEPSVKVVVLVAYCLGARQ